jgi:homopolymeric O-antigen transport system ATP-binding protein
VTESAIRVDRLGKQYRLGAKLKYKSLRDTLTHYGSLAPLRSLVRRMVAPQAEAPADAPPSLFWALKDVSFEVPRGQILGIVGRNGAGKSTLLKILSRITEPTEGEVEIRGRLGSLIEVGTGFHPELTGRENIYLSGAIQGMRKAEIDRKFDDIVAFSELQQFLETPVKLFSSGMYMRLAFAVASHLEPDVLLLDEVLAVGDLAFQKKCLGRMRDVASADRTVLFVSHNLGAIRQMCSRVLWIDQGRILGDGRPDDIIRQYQNAVRENPVDGQTNLSDRLNRCSGAVRFNRVSVHDEADQARWEFKEGETLRIRLEYKAFDAVSDLWIYFALTSGGTSEIVTNTKLEISAGPLPAGATGVAVLEIPHLPLRQGEYYLYLLLRSGAGRPYDCVEYQNTSLPPVVISTDSTDPERIMGSFSLDVRLRDVKILPPSEETRPPLSSG